MDFALFKQELEKRFPQLTFECFVSVRSTEVTSLIYVRDNYNCIMSLTRDNNDATVVFLADFRAHLLGPRKSRHFQRSKHYREDEVEDLMVRLIEEYLTERRREREENEHPQA